MANATHSVTTAEPSATDPTTDNGDRRQGHRRRWLLAGVLVLVAAAATVVGVTNPFGTAPASTSAVTDNADPTSLATVTRQDLSSQTELSATLGYAGTYTVINQAGSSSGSSSAGSTATYTWLAAVGQVVSQGQTLYDVNGSPVVLLYGSTPAYRSLSEDLTGADVTELNADLVALGYATATEIPAGTDTFTWWTEVGVDKLQAALGYTQTGTLTLGQAVFLPTAARVTSLTATLGGPAQSGGTVLDATSTARQVSIALDAAQQSQVQNGRQGDHHLARQPDHPRRDLLGRHRRHHLRPASSAGSSSDANSDSSGGSDSSGSGSSAPTITVLVTPTDPAATGSWDQAPVNVTITTASTPNALVVPVDALIALASGGYAVETVNATGVHSLVPVSLGVFDDADGLVQITSSGLAVGQRVVVPAT